VNENISRTKENFADILGDAKKEVIGLYAIGGVAKDLLDDYALVNGKIDFPLFMFDGSKDKWGTEPLVKGVKVQSPDEIAASGVTRLVICNAAHFDAIYQGLKHLEEKNIVIKKFMPV
jgi:hypothetical protein